jgi:hypothetical protein
MIARPYRSRYTQPSVERRYMRSDTHFCPLRQEGGRPILGCGLVWSYCSSAHCWAQSAVYIPPGGIPRPIPARSLPDSSCSSTQTIQSRISPGVRFRMLRSRKGGKGRICRSLWS